MSQNDILSWVLLIITIGLLVIGLGSVLIGRLVVLYDAFVAWAKTRQPVKRSYVQPRPRSMVRTGTEIARTIPVRPQQYQVQDSTEGENVPAAEPPAISHNMSREEIIVLLSLQKDGAKYRYSKNQIAAFVGGTRAEVLTRIDEIRVPPKPEVQQVHSGQRLERPANGW